MKIQVELTEKELRELVYTYIANQFIGADISADDVRIEVKSKQNYKSEWEEASFRAVVSKIV